MVLLSFPTSDILLFDGLQTTVEMSEHFKLCLFLKKKEKN